MYNVNSAMECILSVIVLNALTFASSLSVDNSNIKLRFAVIGVVALLLEINILLLRMKCIIIDGYAVIRLAPSIFAMVLQVGLIVGQVLKLVREHNVFYVFTLYLILHIPVALFILTVFKIIKRRKTTMLNWRKYR